MRTRFFSIDTTPSVSASPDGPDRTFADDAKERHLAIAHRLVAALRSMI